MARQKRHATVKSSTAEATDSGILAATGYRWLKLSGFPNAVGIGPAAATSPTYYLSTNALPWDLSLITQLTTDAAYAVFYNMGSGTWTKVAQFTLDKALLPQARQVVWAVTYANGAVTASAANLCANPV